MIDTWVLRSARPGRGHRVGAGSGYKGDSKLAISGSIKVELTAKETLKVRVGANRSSDNNATEIAGVEDRLFDARMGPDASGAVDLPLDVHIPAKKYVG